MHAPGPHISRLRLLSFWLVPLLAVSLLIACDDDSDGDVDAPDAESREEFQEDAQARIDDLEREADELRDRLADESGEGRDELEQQLEDLEGEIAEGRDRLRDLISADDADFEAARDEFEDFADGISGHLDDLRDDIFN